jgi:hypothetical protein
VCKCARRERSEYIVADQGQIIWPASNSVPKRGRCPKWYFLRTRIIYLWPTSARKRTMMAADILARAWADCPRCRRATAWGAVVFHEIVPPLHGFQHTHDQTQVASASMVVFSILFIPASSLDYRTFSVSSLTLCAQFGY